MPDSGSVFKGKTRSTPSITKYPPGSVLASPMACSTSGGIPFKRHALHCKTRGIHANTFLVSLSRTQHS